MENLNLWLEPYWQVIAYTCVSFVGLVGILALANPQLFTAIANRCSQWFDTSKLGAVVDTKVDVDTFTLQHCRVYGVIVFVLAAVTTIVTTLVPSWKPIAYGCLGFAGLLGLLAIVRPKWFITLATKSNVWIDTSKFGEFIDKSIDLDTMILRHSRAFGAILLTSAAVVAII